MTESLVLINLFSMPAGRALDPDATFPVVNVARWDSVDDWQAASAEHFSGPGELGGGDDERDPAEPADSWGAVRAHPALYAIAHVTPDPRGTAPGAHS